MRLFPRVRLGLVLRRRHVHRVMHPAVPGRRDFGGLREPVIDHPAALESEGRIDLAAARAVIAIAEFVVADELAVESRPHLGSEGLAVPPGEKAQQESLHRRVRRSTLPLLSAALMPFRGGDVQESAEPADATSFIRGVGRAFMLSCGMLQNAVERVQSSSAWRCPRRRIGRWRPRFWLAPPSSRCCCMQRCSGWRADFMGERQTFLRTSSRDQRADAARPAAGRAGHRVADDAARRRDRRACSPDCSAW